MKFFDIIKERKYILCSNCFQDSGLKNMSLKIGFSSSKICPNCKTNNGKKLNRLSLRWLAQSFFVRGTVFKCDYGAAPVVQFNEHHYKKSDVEVSEWLKNDIKLIEESIKVGFFHYGPRLWMVGEVEPLKSLQEKTERNQIIETILDRYPSRTFNENESFYRLRKNPTSPENISEYDSPPDFFCGKGRLDSTNLSMLYGSQDIEVCVHECRVTVEDELYLATITTKKELKLLDITEILDDDTTEFESIDIAIHMLFLAGEHSYEISRDIAIAAKERGYEGIIYPSYFSLLKTGSMPFDTIYGISIRKLPVTVEYAKSQIIQNIALFGRPIQEEIVKVACINKLILNKIIYDFHFGPVGF